MSVKKIGPKEIEVITDKHEIYIRQEKTGYLLDYFNSKIENNDESFEDSIEVESFTSLSEELKNLGVSSEQILEIRKIYKLI